MTFRSMTFRSMTFRSKTFGSITLPCFKARTVNRSMRAHMAFGFTFVLAIVLLFTNISLMLYLRYSTQLNWEKLLSQAETSLRSELTESTISLRDPQTFAEEESREMQALGVNLLMLDARDQVIFAPKDLVIAFKKAGRKVQWPLDKDNKWYSHRIPWKGRYFVLALSSFAEENVLRKFSILLGTLSLLILVASSTGAWFLVGRTLAPLEALSQQALSRQEQPDTTGARAELQSPSDDWEMLQLVTTINGLLARLDADTLAKARFYAAASHELRTPLQSLSGFLELGLSRERTESEYRDALREAHAQSRDLITLVNDLLTLNQLETTAAPLTRDEVDVADVSERTVQRLRPQIHEKNLQLYFHLQVTNVLYAPWSHVEMLLRNVLENAVKYATVNGKVRIKSDKDSFEVFNECAPTSGWDDEKILEPFFRPDASRNSQTGGNGLGLAISKAICDANRWQLQVHQTDGGVTARINFHPSRNA